MSGQQAASLSAAVGVPGAANPRHREGEGGVRAWAGGEPRCGRAARVGVSHAQYPQLPRPTPCRKLQIAPPASGPRWAGMWTLRWQMAGRRAQLHLARSAPGARSGPRARAAPSRPPRKAVRLCAAARARASQGTASTTPLPARSRTARRHCEQRIGVLWDSGTLHSFEGTGLFRGAQRPFHPTALPSLRCHSSQYWRFCAGQEQSPSNRLLPSHQLCVFTIPWEHPEEPDTHSGRVFVRWSRLFMFEFGPVRDG